MHPGTATSVDWNPWPHRLAWGLVCVVFPLIWVGGLVTTYDAGMAVPDWPGTYGYNLFLYPWTTWVAGPWDLFIEHGHRLLGSLAGLLTIALVLTAFVQRGPQGLKTFSLMLLGLVVVQGVLGGLRVRMRSEQLAMIHGCVGPFYFACCSLVLTLTSRQWSLSQALPDSAGLTRSSLAGFIMAYGQLVLGAMLRHPASDGSPHVFRIALLFHLFFGITLAAHILSLAWQMRKNAANLPWLMHPAVGLALLVAGQIVLGFATLILKYGWPTWLGGELLAAGFTVRARDFGSAIITTLHVANGSLILALMASLWLRCQRVCGWGRSEFRSPSAMATGVLT